MWGQGHSLGSGRVEVPRSAQQGCSQRPRLGGTEDGVTGPFVIPVGSLPTLPAPTPSLGP